MIGLLAFLQCCVLLLLVRWSGSHLLKQKSIKSTRRNFTFLCCRSLSAFANIIVISTIILFTSVPTTAKALEDENSWKELPTRTASQCFNVRGVPVVNLRCGRDELIRIEQAFYGATPAEVSVVNSDQSAICSYSGDSGDCIQLTSVKGSCMGRSVCTLPVSNPFLRNCEQYASYLQVNYTCVPKERIASICEQEVSTSWRGYISTPRYPSRYPPNTSCQCSLKTKDRSILLTILDFSLNTSGRPAGKCAEDKLHIEGWGSKCNPVVPEGLPETLGLREKSLTLRFESDRRRQGRGFWIEYRGSNGGKVTMTCGVRPKPPRTTQIPTRKPSYSKSGHNKKKKNTKKTTTNDSREKSDLRNILSTEATKLHSIDNESTSDLDYDDDYEMTTEVNNVIVDDGDPSLQPPESGGRRPPEEEDNQFDTYDFSDHADQYQLYNIGEVQLTTGVVVSVLILVAVIIIIVLVFRR